MSCSTQTARALAAALVVTGSSLMVSACNKQQGQTEAPPSARPMRSPDEAEAVFAEAEKELGDLFANEAPAHTYGQPQPSAGLTPSAPPPAAGDAKSTDRQSREMSRCTRACKALASMQRAADRLCELTGEADDRCTGVRARVDAARAVVEQSCKSCDD